jgi:type 1 glutamine amidotransferase
MPATFTATDELYHQMKFLPSTQIVAVAYDDPKMGGTGQDEPMLCANQYGHGRVFYTALGHDLAAMKKSINAKTKMVFIANPDNPTGTYVTKRELDEFIN